MPQASGTGAFAPAIFETPQPNHAIATCQHCHMPMNPGKACNKSNAILRPTGSVEHPNSGVPQHDLTGGNVWVSSILASTVPGSANYDATNASLLNNIPGLTLDLTQGEGVDPVAMLNGADRALLDLQSAATLRGLPADISDASPPLGAGERYVDALVYEMKPSSSLTGESHTFHFVLSDGRNKDNRIPPQGFRIAEAAARHIVPVYGGVEDPSYFTSAEYLGGYDEVTLSVAPGAASVEVELYYQTTSRE